MKKCLRSTILESRYLPPMLLFAAAFALFSNTFASSWTYDDFPVIVNNPDIRSLWDFGRNIRGGRPLRELTLLIDYQIFGLNPAGYHFQNIFWHALNASLVFAFAVRLGSTKLVAWAAAVLFLVHPVQVEVVANISNRKDSLALTFLLLSFLAYHNAVKPAGRRILWVSVSLILAFMAYQAKENTLALPIILIGYEIVYLPSKERFLLHRFWPWLSLFAVAVMTFVAWYFFFGGRDIFLQASHENLWRMNYFPTSSESVYFRTVLKSWGFMFQKLLIPAKLAPDYIYEVPGSWFDPWVVFAFVTLAFYGAFLVYTFYRSNITFFSLVWLGAFWLPTANLFPLSYFAADRYLYTPSVGFFVVVGLLLDKFLRHPKIRIGIILVLALVLSGLTWKQNAVWHSPFSLWNHTVKITPQSVHALNNLGTLNLRKGDYEQALAFFLQAKKANPYHAISHYHLGVAYEKLGERQKAIEHYRNFCEMDLPRNRFMVMVLRERLENEYGVKF